MYTIFLPIADAAAMQSKVICLGLDMKCVFGCCTWFWCPKKSQNGYCTNCDDSIGIAELLVGSNGRTNFYFKSGLVAKLVF